MAEFPSLPLWTDAYLADTRHLTTLENGAYLMLLMEAWRRPRCSLPDDDILLARLAGLPADEWAEIRDTIMAFWRLDRRSNEWTQKRLKNEKLYLEKKRGKQRSAAKRRWDKEKTPSKRICQTDAPTPTPTPTPIKEKISPCGDIQKKAAPRGSRIPVDWRPTDIERAYARQRGLDPDEIAEDFRDYWTAKTGSNATKADWQATWRMWCRKAARDKPEKAFDANAYLRAKRNGGLPL